VDALSLLVATGEMFFLLGRNGVERRSLIKILTILCVIRVI
jgi:ABC-type branched-subunit amino acid transport system ATPase component